MRDEEPSSGKPPISVVIPTYNHSRFLPQAIDSALMQTVKPIEILVADDGSTDDTAEVVARYGGAVKYRRFEHSGVYSVRQAMLAEIRGDWFLNLDADNWIESDFLEKMSAAIQVNEKDEKFAFAYPDMELFGDVSGQVQRPEFDPRQLKARNYVDMNSVIRTEVAQRFGFDPAFNSGQGDYDFFLTLAENGYRGVRVLEAILHYRVHSNSISRNVARKRRQRKIVRRIVRKHNNFFSPIEARAALAKADNSILVSLINSRSPFTGFGGRLADWLRFARSGWRHAEFSKQTVYCFLPRRYFESSNRPAEIFFLFRDTPERREIVRRVMGGGNGALAGGQLFGFEELWKSGQAMDSNLRLPRTSSVLQTAHAWVEHFYAHHTGVGLGDVDSVRAHLWQMNRAKVVVATSDNMGLPALHLKTRGRLKVPLVYVSIGLPERMMAVEAKSPARATRYRRRMSCVDRFVAYGWAEAEWLRQWLGDEKKVRFVPFGVDTETWRPEADAKEEIDVLGIGYDPMRDFDLLADFARRYPAVSVCLATSRERAKELGNLPSNLQIRIRVPIEKLKDIISAARVVVLPVKENTYSGATTTLLQCMAMGKAVAVSRVGAIREGYGFEDGVNLRWMEPGSQKSLDKVVAGLLMNPELRHRLGEAARRHVVENLGWNRYVGKIEKCLEGLPKKNGF